MKVGTRWRSLPHPDILIRLVRQSTHILFEAEIEQTANERFLGCATMISTNELKKYWIREHTKPDWEV